MQAAMKKYPAVNQVQILQIYAVINESLQSCQEKMPNCSKCVNNATAVFLRTSNND